MEKRGRKRIDRMGRRYGRLTVLGPADIILDNSRTSVWLCRCDCGRELYVRGSSLHSHGSMSCGCLREEMNAKRWEEYHRRHGRTEAAK